MQTSTIAEAKSHLSQLINKAEMGDIIHLSRHGKLVAVLLSENEYQNITNQHIPSWEAITQWRSELSAHPDQSESLSDEEIDSWRDESEMREFSWE